ncbi:helix-turn-helix transcriptional regulator [Streptomyces sp. DH-12]|uniref:helix-turn-helix domain-containing protein n=2 Tax=unclassified Streptomyces TaxID=2593676 RepID=UPI001F530EF8|nr:helix-turn-helix transcriptional regulator [Streptomyces sp. DH-12]
MSAQDEVTRFAALLRELKGRTDRSYGSLARRLHMNTSTLHRYCAGDAVPVDFAPVERFAALCGATDAERLELHRRWLRAAEARRRPRGGAARDAKTPDPSGAAPGTAGRRSGAPGHGSGPDVPGNGAPAAGSDTTGPGTTGSGAAGSDTTGPGTTGSGAAGSDTTGPGAADSGTTGSGAAGSGAADQANDSGHPEGPGGGDGHAVRGPAGHGDVPTGRRRQRRRAAVAAAAVCALLATVGSLSFLPDDRRAAAGSKALGATEEAAEGGAGDGAGSARSVAPARSPSASASGSPSPSGSAPAGRGGDGEASEARRPSGSPAAPDRAPAGPPPLTWSVDSHAWAHGCGHDYVVAKPPARVPPPPVPQDARTWADAQDAVHGGETLVELSVQGRSDTAVVLTALRVRVAGRSEPAPGTAYAMDQGCGGALTPRYFDVDLDKDRPIARAVAGNDTGTPVPAVRMPYRVSAADPEVLLVTARTEGCDCRWYLELDWSSQGRAGTVRIDDRGRPFRTSAVEGLPHYEYDTLNRSWRPRGG